MAVILGLQSPIVYSSGVPKDCEIRTGLWWGGREAGMLSVDQ